MPNLDGTPTEAEVIAWGLAAVKAAYKKAGHQPEGPEGAVSLAANFLDFAEMVADVVKDWPEKRRSDPQTLAFALGLRRLRDNFAQVVEADPLIIYVPAHQAVREFHASQAYIRYFRAPNRSSKTQAGLIDDAWMMRGEHPWRRMAPQPLTVALIVPNFAKQAANVIIPKLLAGETGNPLSPLFPMDGKWFNHWDSDKYILTIGCRECAEHGKAKSCKHPKSRLTIFSAEEPVLAIAGGQYAQVHYDEQVPRAFFSEGLKRTETVPHSGHIVTETPLGGKGFWTHTILTKAAEAGLKVGASDQTFCSLHTCTQFDTGLTPKDKIEASLAVYSVQEAEARVYGRPASFSESGVFDTFQVSSMLEAATNPARGRLRIRGMKGKGADGARTLDVWAEDDASTNAAQLLRECAANLDIEFTPEPDSGHIRLWEAPKPFCQYIIGADVAQGLTHADASCAQVIKVDREGQDLVFTLVASWHGWVNSLAYAPELYKLSLWYNEAQLVVERRGPGDATINVLKDLCCYTMYRDLSDPANFEFSVDSRFGVDTNVKTKGVFISMLQSAVWDPIRQRRALRCYDAQTLDELGCYAQERTDTGLTYRFRGVSGTHDDRVMALAFAIYAVYSQSMYDVSLEQQRRQHERLVGPNNANGGPHGSSPPSGHHPRARVAPVAFPGAPVGRETQAPVGRPAGRSEADGYGHRRDAAPKGRPAKTISGKPAPRLVPKPIDPASY